MKISEPVHIETSSMEPEHVEPDHLKFVVEHGNIMLLKEFNPKEAAVLLRDAIKNSSINMSEGWEQRFIANYGAILSNSKDMFDTIVFDDGSTLLDAALVVNFPGTFDYDGQYILKGITYSTLAKQPNIMTRLDNPGCSKLVAGYFEFTAASSASRPETSFITEWTAKSTERLSFASCFYLVVGAYKRGPYTKLSQRIIETLMLLDRFDILANIEFVRFSSVVTEIVGQRIIVNSGCAEYLASMETHLKKCFNSSLISLETAKKLLDTAPSFVVLPEPLTPEDLKTFTEITWKLINLPAPQKAYYLGFPIHLGIPGNKALYASITQLNTLGVEAYSEKMVKLGEPLVTVPGYPGIIASTTEENLYGQKCADFGPFDRFQYIEDGHVFEFTRDSWSNLLKNGSDNPYTRKPLSREFLSMIETRVSIAQTCKLPKVLPLSELLLSLEGGESEDHQPHPDCLCEYASVSSLASNLFLHALVSALPSSEVRMV